MALASETDIEELGDPRPLETADVETATSSIARAFAWHEPFGEWAMPDEATREQRLTERIGEDIRNRFLADGECWTIAGVSVTLWIPPLSGDGTESLAARRSEADYAEFGDRGDALRAGDKLISSLKPPNPHWFLDTIATAPEFHRRGLAGRLLDHDLARRDEAGDTCALDTHTPMQIALYESRGFEITGNGRLGPDLDVYVMVRPPGG